MLKLKQNAAIFSIGGISYSIIEILWRGYTHWSMTITGGVCCVTLFRVFNRMNKSKLHKKCIVGSAIITGIEFISGCIFNLWLKMNVWDYSKMKFNLFGQVCPLYMFFWGLLSIPAAKLSGLISKRYKLIKKIM